jgi:hypothetical protein
MVVMHMTLIKEGIQLLLLNQLITMVIEIVIRHQLNTEVKKKQIGKYA